MDFKDFGDIRITKFGGWNVSLANQETST